MGFVNRSIGWLFAVEGQAKCRFAGRSHHPLQAELGRNGKDVVGAGHVDTERDLVGHQIRGRNSG